MTIIQYQVMMKFNFFRIKFYDQDEIVGNNEE